MDSLIGKMVWITKDALTKGIFSGVVSGDIDGLIGLKNNAYGYYKLGVEAFLTEAEAEAKAMNLRDEKIKSLENQIKKLSSMKFKSNE